MVGLHLAIAAQYKSTSCSVTDKNMSGSRVEMGGVCPVADLGSILVTGRRDVVPIKSYKFVQVCMETIL